jgi:hypothetical protein
MSIVCGLDLHRQQITFDAVETELCALRRRRDIDWERGELEQSTRYQYPRSTPS